MAVLAIAGSILSPICVIELGVNHFRNAIDDLVQREGMTVGNHNGQDDWRQDVVMASVHGLCSSCRKRSEYVGLSIKNTTLERAQF